MINKNHFVLYIFLVIFKIAQSQSVDTVKIIALVSDTSDKHTLTTDYHALVQACDSCPVAYKQNDKTYKDRNTYWITAFEVRSVVYQEVNDSFNPNYILPNGATTLMGSPTTYVKKPFYFHKDYLDDSKNILSKKVVVWQTQQINIK